MSRYPNSVLRIESADLDLAGEEIKHLPIYAGVRIAGRSHVEKRGDRLALTMSAGGAQRRYAIKARKITFSTGASFCFACPECKKWRKRLFLVETTDDSKALSFLCKECGSIDNQSQWY